MNKQIMLLVKSLANLNNNLYQNLFVARSMKLAALLFLLSLTSCSSDSQQVSAEKDKSPDIEEQLIDANKAAVRTEDEQIEDFIRRHKWEVETTETGLRYIIDDEGNGNFIKDGDLVSLNYAVKLISGDVIYTSDEFGSMKFLVGKEDVISGLLEGVKMLKNDGRARFVIPSHLAYGLIGDNDKIGQKATLIYKVQIINIEN